MGVHKACVRQVFADFPDLRMDSFQINISVLGIPARSFPIKWADSTFRSASGIMEFELGDKVSLNYLASKTEAKREKIQTTVNYDRNA